MSGPSHPARAGVVCVVGSLNEDIGLRVPALPKPGETVLSTGRRLGPGGKGANQAAAAGALGARVAMVGAVGADGAGDRSLDALTTRGVDVSRCLRRSDDRTGTAIVVVDDAGENHIVVDSGANSTLTADEVAAAVLDLQPAVVLAQLEVPVEGVAAALRARPAATTILNPAPMPPDARPILGLLADVDLLVPNRTELGQLAGRPEPRTAAEVAACVAGLGASGDVVVTMGADGAFCFPAAGEPVWLEAETVEAVDTSGAGDVFCGALAQALAAGSPLLDAARIANRAAAASTGHPGAQVPAGFTG